MYHLFCENERFGVICCCFFKYHDTMCAFISQLGLYMREYRVYYLAVQMTAYGRSSSV